MGAKLFFTWRVWQKPCNSHKLVKAPHAFDIIQPRVSCYVDIAVSIGKTAKLRVVCCVDVAVSIGEAAKKSVLLCGCRRIDRGSAKTSLNVCVEFPAIYFFSDMIFVGAAEQLPGPFAVWILKVLACRQRTCAPITQTICLSPEIPALLPYVTWHLWRLPSWKSVQVAFVTVSHIETCLAAPLQEAQLKFYKKVSQRFRVWSLLAGSHSTWRLHP